jgi:hypothetical protein
LVLGIGGFLAGVGLLLVGAFNTDRSEDFVRTSGFAAWATTIGVQTAFWAIVAWPLWSDLSAAWRQTRFGRSATLALVAPLALILVGFPLISVARRIDWPLWGQSVKTAILTIVGGLFVGVPALSGIVLLQERIRRRETEPIDQEDIQAGIEARAGILRFLSTAGAVIGLAVLASGALRRATVPTFVDEETFPAEAVLLYGAFFTSLLLLAYVPAHIALRRHGQRIRDTYFPLEQMPDPTADTFKGWLDRRTTLETLLQVNVTPLQQLQASLFILAPLLSATLTVLVPKPS